MTKRIFWKSNFWFSSALLYYTSEYFWNFEFKQTFEILKHPSIYAMIWILPNPLFDKSSRTQTRNLIQQLKWVITISKEALLRRILKTFANWNIGVGMSTHLVEQIKYDHVVSFIWTIKRWFRLLLNLPL